MENRNNRIITVYCENRKLHINGDGFSTAFGTSYIQPGQTYDSEIGIEFQDYDMSSGKRMRKIKTLTFALEIAIYDAEHNELDKYTTETYTLKTSLAK